MNSKINRRDFLKGASMASVYAAAGVGAGSTLALANPQIKRIGGPKLKISLNAYSFSKKLNDYKKGLEGGISLFDLLDFCAKNNFDAVDATGYFFPGYPSELPTDSFINEFKRRAFELGLDISGTGVRNNFTLPDKAGEVRLCTSFGEFKRAFGDFSTDVGQKHLAHAVYGFFNNGGTRCYVVRMKAVTELAGILEKFAAIDEIALVAAPGIIDANVVDVIVTHCKTATQDRFAIFDSAETITGDLTKANIKPPPNSDYAAFYFPWIQVFDPATKIQDPKSDGRIPVPPSGHVAGIYARVDTNRGVHKAPANEVVLGALGLKYNVSKATQDGLNPDGINCIRELNGNIRVWGARTIGGDANGEWRYVNVRRLFLFLRESIDEGTQWIVFEPNTPDLWSKITRNITAFLTNVWRAGALFGATPQEAFYVKCDAETNPPEVRDAGQVVTEIGVAVVKPAEFVIFKISQWAGPGV